MKEKNKAKYNIQSHVDVIQLSNNFVLIVAKYSYKTNYEKKFN